VPTFNENLANKKPLSDLLIPRLLVSLAIIRSAIALISAIVDDDDYEVQVYERGYDFATRNYSVLKPQGRIKVNRFINRMTANAVISNSACAGVTLSTLTWPSRGQRCVAVER